MHLWWREGWLFSSSKVILRTFLLFHESFHFLLNSSFYFIYFHLLSFTSFPYLLPSSTVIFFTLTVDWNWRSLAVFESWLAACLVACWTLVPCFPGWLYFFHGEHHISTSDVSRSCRFAFEFCRIAIYICRYRFGYRNWYKNRLDAHVVTQTDVKI